MFAFKPKKTLPGLCGIGLFPAGACMVRVLRGGGQRPQVAMHEFRPWNGDTDRDAVLAAMRRDHELDRSRCTLLLGEADYNLVLTEAPDVPRDELKSAIRWRIKDLIDFHINDATLDVFDLPGEAGPGKPRSLYAVAAKTPAIQQQVDLLDGAGINLSVIDIPEMAQRNLAALTAEDGQGVLLLSFAASSGLITVTRAGEIYLTRRLDVGTDTLAREGDLSGYFDRVVLEIQRSLDYYDSYFRPPPLAAVMVAPLPVAVPGLLEYLRVNLNAPVAALDLSHLLEWEGGPDTGFLGHCLAVLGASLRYEETVL